jgi:hypothetical protein
MLDSPQNFFPVTTLDNIDKIRIIFNLNSIKNDLAGENYKNEKNWSISKNNQKNWK